MTKVDLKWPHKWFVVYHDDISKDQVHISFGQNLFGSRSEHQKKSAENVFKNSAMAGTPTQPCLLLRFYFNTLVFDISAPLFLHLDPVWLNFHQPEWNQYLK